MWICLKKSSKQHFDGQKLTTEILNPPLLIYTCLTVGQNCIPDSVHIIWGAHGSSAKWLMLFCLSCSMIYVCYSEKSISRTPHIKISNLKFWTRRVLLSNIGKISMNLWNFFFWFYDPLPFFLIFWSFRNFKKKCQRMGWPKNEKNLNKI